jgi:hypothetical protein
VFTNAFIKGAAERAVKTFLQTFAAVMSIAIGGELIPAVGLGGVDWLQALSVSAVATIYSLATSIGNADFTAGSK